MKVFLAGATGAVGQRLVPKLVAAGHEVVGTTRAASKLAELEANGAEGVVVDGLDRDGVVEAVRKAQPDVIVHQLTALSGSPDYKHFDRYFAATNQLRTVGTDNLIAGARAAGVPRIVAQSYTGWPNPRSGSWVKTEDDPLDSHPTAVSRESLAAIRYVESVVPALDGITGVVLRFGSFYGPGTSLGAGGEIVDLIRARKFPIVGGGTGVWSFLHIDDAATATIAALDHGTAGLYNVVDDDPAPVTQWLPYLAECLGAKAPMKVPGWLVRPLLGEHTLAAMTSMRGSSNAKAKRELGWIPSHASWREGFRTALG